jgi:high-affinity iron transporter
VTRPGLALTVLALAVVGLAAHAAEPGREDLARRTIHLLEYIAADYPGAVENGAVKSESEYREQLDFAAQVRTQLRALGVGESDPILSALGRFDVALAAPASADSVAAQAHALAASVRERFDVRAVPLRTPDLAKGRALYAQTCAPCHGAAGAGDGPAGKGLDPPPANLLDPSRAAALSPFAFWSTVTYGIGGTAMAPFEKQLDETARWDLAFYVGSLGFSADAIGRGKALVAANRDAALVHVPDLATLTHESAAELAAGDRDAAAVVAFLRSDPGALESDASPMDVARSRLAASLAAFQGGDVSRALDLAVSSYLDGFEQVEPTLNAIDGGLRAQIEAEFVRYRGALRSGVAAAEIAAIHRSLADQLARADRELSGASLGPTTVFFGALTILAREGLEAVLLVVAILAVLGRAGRRDAARFVHAGWITALACGAATWWIASSVVAMSGASREVIEGVSALAAAVILFYVSYWLLSKTEAARWQAFLDDRLKSALSRGSLGMLAFLSFVAVYRECFETVLFFQALAAEAGPKGQSALAAGIGAGSVVLGLLALVVFRFGRRLPMRRFFAASSVLLYGLSVVLAGHGVAALQEAGWIPATPVSLFRFEWLGIYPTVQGLAVQGVLLVAALAALPLVVGSFSSEPKRV